MINQRLNGVIKEKFAVIHGFEGPPPLLEILLGRVSGVKPNVDTSPTVIFVSIPGDSGHVVLSFGILTNLHNDFLAEGVDPSEGAPFAMLAPIQLTALTGAVVRVTVLTGNKVAPCFANPLGFVASPAANKELFPIE